MKQRFRLTYQKGEELRYTSNLDLHKIFERWMRRARLPLAYSQGYHPQPRLNQAAPLPLGMLSICEILEFWVEGISSPAMVSNALVTALQPGITIDAIEDIPANAPSIQTLVNTITYMACPIQAMDGLDELPKQVNTFLNLNTLVRTRREKTYDLRPLVMGFDVLGESTPTTLVMTLLSRPGQTGRPDEVMDALGYDPALFRYIRTKITLVTD